MYDELKTLDDVSFLIYILHALEDGDEQYVSPAAWERFAVLMSKVN
jgi:hypothetical protein